MHLILDHIKQGLDTVGKQLPSQTSDPCGTDGNGCQPESSTCPSSGNSQVMHVQVHVYCSLFVDAYCDY